MKIKNVLDKAIIYKMLAVFCTICILLSSCSQQNDIPSPNTDVESDSIPKVQLVNEENRDLIGKELQENDLTILVPKDGSRETENIQKIPKNNIVQSTIDDSVFPGISICEMHVDDDGNTPEVICPNGAVGIFSKSNSRGWPCIKGDYLSWSFTKYPLDSQKDQAICVGYIKDGVMYKPQLFQKGLEINYKQKISEDGLYYLYILGASSDPVTIKSGNIELISQ